MSFCLWSDRAAARAAAGRPRHVEAASLALEMYARYDLEFHRVTKGTDGPFAFEPYDRPPTPQLRARLRRLLTGLSAPRRLGQADRPGPRARRPHRWRSRVLSTLLIPSIVAEVTIALVLGAVVAAVVGPARLVPFEPGIRFAAGPLLRAGIVLLGARLSLGEIARIGLPALGTIVVTMAVSLGLVLLLARVVKVENRLAVLLAVGSAVCGNTAIAATAPVIAARPREVAYAVATITLFGTLAVLLYPSIGHLVGLSQSSFGLWAGVAIHDTSQVVAAGAAYGPAALDVAAVVKLIRNALMAPLLMLIAWGWASYGDEVGDAVGRGARPPLRRAIPPFVLGFLALAALRSVGLIEPGAGRDLRHDLQGLRAGGPGRHRACRPGSASCARPAGARWRSASASP